MKKQSNNWKIISVGGSIIIPKTGFDVEFLKKFRELILAQLKKGERFILIIGGGFTCRQYQQAAQSVVPINKTDLDWIGIYTTRLNAEMVLRLFKGVAHPEVILNPNKKVPTKKNLIIAAGWQPGCSTDNDAVLLAKTYGVHEVFNLSNIEYVYDKDPNKFPDAKKIEEIDWKTFRKNVVGNKWEAGKNAPFDPTASRAAEKLKLTVKILCGTDLENVERATSGASFIGTVIRSL